MTARSIARSALLLALVAGPAAAQTPGSVDPKPLPPLTMASLPAECRQVLAR